MYDARALLKKTHPLFRSTTCSSQCATIIVFMQLADNHLDIVTRCVSTCTCIFNSHVLERCT